jgi:hypothetical protein
VLAEAVVGLEELVAPPGAVEPAVEVVEQAVELLEPLVAVGRLVVVVGLEVGQLVVLVDVDSS